jgi:Fic family protein
MHPDMFSDSPAGTVIRVGDGDSAYWAYVPKPLPPKIEPSLDLMQVLSESDRALGELSGLGRTISNPHLLIGPFIRREAVDSSRIEGTHTDLPGLYAYESERASRRGRKAMPEQADAQEVLNYVRATEYGIRKLKTRELDLKLIGELHRRLMIGVRGNRATPGRFRKVQNWIGTGGGLTQAIFVPPPVAEMTASLAELEKYILGGNSLPPLIRIALIHYQFEGTHPFIDGNGRIGRLLISLLLVKWGLLPLPLLYLSSYFERHRREYYDLLLAISGRGLWQDWLVFFLKGVAEQSRDAIARAKRLQDLQLDWRTKLLKQRAPAALLLLADHLFDSPVLSIPQAQRLLELSYPGTQKVIGKLVDLRILTPADESEYGKLFIAREILRISVKGTSDHEIKLFGAKV